MKSNHIELFETIATRLENLDGVSRNRKGSLVAADGGVRAMTSKGAIVVKLDPFEVADCVAKDQGEHHKGLANAWSQLASNLVDERVYGPLLLAKAPAAK